MNTKRFLTILLIVVSILLIPLIAMQFTEEVNWTVSDFVIGGMLLFGFGLLLDFALKTLKHSKYRIVIGIAIILTFILIWMELAVGFFGTPFAGS